MNKRASKEKTRPDWQTPASVYEPIVEALGLTLDTATSGITNTILPHFLEGPCWGRVLSCTCGLCSPWTEPSWCNPPYGQTILPLWVNKALAEYQNRGTISALLVPNNTETQWFSTLWEYCSDIVFLEGRVPFIAPPGHEEEGEEKSGNTGGSIVAVFGDVGGVQRPGYPNTYLWRWKVDKYFPVRL